MSHMYRIGRFTPGLLVMVLMANPAQAQDIPRREEQFSIVSQADDQDQDQVRDVVACGTQPRTTTRSEMLDWGTGGVELRGERTKSGRKSVGAMPQGHPWQRTYATDFKFWDSVASGLTFEAGARLERTQRGVADGPLLSNPTKSISQTAFVGFQLNGASFVRLAAYDDGGWSDGFSGDLIRRVANGEPPARKGAALEFGSSSFLPGEIGGKPQLQLRLARGRIATRPDTSATISWKAHF